jgi:hypothetical protein
MNRTFHGIPLFGTILAGITALTVTGCGTGIPFLSSTPPRTIQQSISENEHVLEQIRTTITRNTSYTNWQQSSPTTPLFPCTDGENTTSHAWAITSSWSTPAEPLQPDIQSITAAVNMILAQYGIPQGESGLSMRKEGESFTVKITMPCAPVNPAIG